MGYMVRFVQPPGKAATGFHDIPLYSDGTPMQTTEELGQYRSAGCVRQRDDKAQQLYEWGADRYPGCGAGLRRTRDSRSWMHRGMLGSATDSCHRTLLVHARVTDSSQN